MNINYTTSLIPSGGQVALAAVNTQCVMSQMVSSDTEVGLRHAFTNVKYDDSVHGENMRATGQFKPPRMMMDSDTERAADQFTQVLWCHVVKMSKTRMSPRTFSLLSYLYIHKCFIYMYRFSFFSFITNIYKDNYDSLSINEQFSTSVLEMLKPV